LSLAERLILKVFGAGGRGNAPFNKEDRRRFGIARRTGRLSGGPPVNLAPPADYGILWKMITIVAGTNRPGSNTREIAARIDEIYASFGTPRQILDLATLPPEIFHSTSYAAKPKSFEPFTEAILKSDGLVVVSPEYNGGMPGVLKYFIDMLPFPESFERRPVCFVGLAAGIWGALRPVEQLQLIFGYRNAYLYPERVFIPRVGEALDENGALKSAELRPPSLASRGVCRLRRQISLKPAPL